MGQGFEELCAQLARSESPPTARFKRKGIPDAGVECYCVLPDGNEWAWQAKYFDQLGDSQFSQIDESVKTALEKHPSLIQYFVCVPLDRPDARLPNRKSAMQRWEDHVAKWNAWAAELGRTVDFVWWGSSELIERLARSENIGRVFFWFNEPAFDEPWFKARLNEAIRAAGPRYTPEIHLDVPMSTDLAYFGRVPSTVDSVKVQAKGIRKEVPFLERLASRHETEIPKSSVQNLLLCVTNVLQSLSNLTFHPVGEIPLEQIVHEIQEAESAAMDCRQLLSSEPRNGDVQHSEKRGSAEHRQGHFQDLRFHLDQFVAKLGVTREAVLHTNQLCNKNLMILSGSAAQERPTCFVILSFDLSTMVHRLYFLWVSVLLGRPILGNRQYINWGSRISLQSSLSEPSSRQLRPHSDVHLL